jgi:ubiquinone/menaquinone biosynthesis C-methylase UbiE
MDEKKQTEQFDSESYRYISSYIDSGGRSDYTIPQSLNSENIQSILDVGCGNGEFLNAWKNHFSAKIGVGIEPSSEGIELVKRKWQSDKELTFQSAFAHNLPYENDSFDLVTTWSVLHWIGRNEYLQSIGEMIRVSSKYLCVMDFVASADYRTPYHHKEGLYTYKQNFDDVISASGIMRPLETLRWWVDPQSGKVIMLEHNNLEKFEKNILSYHARQLVVYEKDYSLLPLKTEKDFS